MFVDVKTDNILFYIGLFSAIEVAINVAYIRHTHLIVTQLDNVHYKHIYNLTHISATI